MGPYPTVSLAEARRHADAARAKVRAGLDPIKERQRERREAARNLHLLQDIAADAFEARKAELKGNGKAGRWFSPLALHFLPKLGQVPVAAHRLSGPASHPAGTLGRPCRRALGTGGNTGRLAANSGSERGIRPDARRRDKDRKSGGTLMNDWQLD